EARELAAERELHRWETRASHDDALIEKAYVRGGDYVSQSQAAQKDHERRQEILDAYDRQRRQAREDVADSRPSENSRGAGGADNIEMTEAKQARIDRLLNNADESGRDRDDWPPDRQPPAPGG